MIAALIIGLISLLIGIAWSFVGEDDSKALLFTIGIASGFFIMLSLSENHSGKDYKQGQIDALNNEYKYEKSIQYELKDSSYIPVDTVYIEIE